MLVRCILVYSITYITSHSGPAFKIAKQNLHPLEPLDCIGLCKL